MISFRYRTSNGLPWGQVVFLMEVLTQTDTPEEFVRQESERDDMNGKAKLKMHGKTFECMFSANGADISSLSAVCMELPNFKVDMLMAEEFKAALLGKPSNAQIIEKTILPDAPKSASADTFILEATRFTEVPDEKLSHKKLQQKDKDFFPGVSEFDPGE